MKVLLISTSEIHGGAAIAANRLMTALQSSGMDVKMIVRDKVSENSNVIQVGSKYLNKWNFYTERALIFANNKLKRNFLFDVSTSSTGLSITHNQAFREADIIHLHWINQGMLSIKEISDIIESGKKVIWTMHDMWPFTGICHHAAGCNRYEISCGICPYLLSSSEKDLSNKVFIKKQAIYRKGKINFVACSKWLRNLASRSPLTNDQSLTNIPNPIDTDIYFPKKNQEVRLRLNLPLDKKVILFAAVKASDIRKGINYLIEAGIELADRTDEILFLIVGNKGEEIQKQLTVPSICMGYVSPKDMSDVYNAADVFVTPSLQENLPNTIMESMSCGTPCVGFNIGGIPEMIDHRHTGYVAEYKNSTDLAKGIKWCLFEADSLILSHNAREKVESEYSQTIIAKQYIDLYNS